MGLLPTPTGNQKSQGCSVRVPRDRALEGVIWELKTCQNDDPSSHFLGAPQYPSSWPLQDVWLKPLYRQGVWLREGE